MESKQSATEQDGSSFGASNPEIGAAVREEIGRGAAEMQLFAYPTSRAFPWATAVLLAASGGFTAAAALCWHCSVCRAENLDDLQPRLQLFTRAVSACSVCSDALAHGEIHRLLLASLNRAGERSARVLTDAALLVCCGTLLERLYGSSAVVAFVVGSTVLSNGLALIPHERMLAVPATEAGAKCSGSGAPSIASTSGGVVALGVLCALRHGRWSAWPGVPVPVFWLLAPILVADLSAAASYLRQLSEYRAYVAAGRERDAVMVAADSEQLPLNLIPPSGFELAVALAACEAVESRVRAQCRAPPEDVVLWREELERAAEAESEMGPPSPPDGAVWADAAGAMIALMVGLVIRIRRH